jgi:GTPase KRas
MLTDDWQLALNHFVETYDPTIEDSYRKMVVIENQMCMLEVLDTAGQEEFFTVRDQWIRAADCFVLVYSITSRSSFARIAGFHQQVLRIKNGTSGDLFKLDPEIGGFCYLPQRLDQPVIILVGNKCDRATEREVSSQEGFALARLLGCSFYECSAKNAINVEKAFYQAVREMRNQRLQQQSQCPQKSTLSTRPNLNSKLHGYNRGSFVRLFWKTKADTSSIAPLDIAQQNALNLGLVEAARRNKRRTVKALLARGAGPNGLPGVDRAALHAAAAVGHVRWLHFFSVKAPQSTQKDLVISRRSRLLQLRATLPSLAYSWRRGHRSTRQAACMGPHY